MSARQSPVERDARELAGEALKGAWRRRRDDTSAFDVFQEAIRSREQSTTWAVQRGDFPRARRQARAAELLEEAQLRMMDRRKRITAAKLARTGIVPGARVVVVHAGYSSDAAPVGTVATLEDTTSTYMFANDDDGRRWILYSGNVEVVPDAPIPDSRIEGEPVEPHDDEWDADDECEGHESLDGAHMGETVYCDGTCRTMRTFA